MVLQGRYRVVNALGGGGFGKTYEILDQKDGVNKVLKVLLKSHPKAIELFQQEAQVLSSLQDPGIPKVDADGYFTFYPKDSDEPLHCLVMEFIEGSNLQDWMKNRRHKPISEEETLDWLKQLSEILGQVHNKNYFHRDIKPHNIMCKPNGQLVLIDFGTAREVSDTYLVKVGQGQNVTGIVSPGYTAPEQTHGKAVPQSDFFSLGRTFVYLLTGKPPTAFPENPRSGKLQWHKSASQISPEMAQIIDYLMAPFPGNRPQNPHMILQCLAELDAKSAGSASKAPLSSPETSGSSKVADKSGKLRVKTQFVPKKSARRSSEVFEWQSKLWAIASVLVVGLTVSQFYGWFRYGMFPANPIVLVNGLLSSRFLETRLQGKLGPIYAIALSPDGKFIAGGSSDTIRIWDLKANKLIHILLEAHKDRVLSLDISQNGEILASGSSDNVIRLWDVEKGIRMRTIPAHEGAVNAVAISPDGQTIVSGSDDKSIKWWNVGIGKRTLTRIQESEVNALAFSRDGGVLASANEDGTIKLWNPSTGTRILTLTGHESAVNAIAISPNSDILASGSHDGTIRLWNLETGTEEKILQASSKPINTLAFAPDGQTLVSGGNRIVIWDLNTGERKVTLLGHAREVSSLAITADGKTLVSSSSDRTIKIWRMP